jgi:hypothetical protein
MTASMHASGIRKREAIPEDCSWLFDEASDPVLEIDLVKKPGTGVNGENLWGYVFATERKEGDDIDKDDNDRFFGEFEASNVPKKAIGPDKFSI